MDLERRFEGLRERKEGAFMPHIYYGDPYLGFSERLVDTLSTNGADMIEFGIPFSDPTADGPTFQVVCQRALKRGITPSECIMGLERLRKDGLNAPVIVTTYYNIPYIMGIECFLEKIKSAGAQGVIIPNLPYEEANSLLKEARRHNIHIILQVAPNTTEERLSRIAEASSGFIYIINVEGVTGVRERFQSSTFKLINRVRKHTDLPILAGFGISNQKQASSMVAAGADGIVAGSVFAQIYEKSINEPESRLQEISILSKQLKAGCIEGYNKRTIAKK